jgi:hypothetical protein
LNWQTPPEAFPFTKARQRVPKNKTGDGFRPGGVKFNLFGKKIVKKIRGSGSFQVVRLPFADRPKKITGETCPYPQKKII